MGRDKWLTAESGVLVPARHYSLWQVREQELIQPRSSSSHFAHCHCSCSLATSSAACCHHCHMLCTRASIACPMLHAAAECSVLALLCAICCSWSLSWCTVCPCWSWIQNLSWHPMFHAAITCPLLELVLRALCYMPEPSLPPSLLLCVPHWSHSPGTKHVGSSSSDLGHMVHSGSWSQSYCCL